MLVRVSLNWFRNTTAGGADQTPSCRKLRFTVVDSKLTLVEAIEQHAYLILEVVQLVALLLLQALDVRDLYTVHICLRIQRHDAQRQQLLQRLQFAVRLHAKPILGRRHVFLCKHKFEHSVNKLWLPTKDCLTEMVEVYSVIMLLYVRHAMKHASVVGCGILE